MKQKNKLVMNIKWHTLVCIKKDSLKRMHRVLYYFLQVAASVVTSPFNLLIINLQNPIDSMSYNGYIGCRLPHSHADLIILSHKVDSLTLLSFI